MAKIPGLKLAIDEVSQTIDFGELFDADLSESRELKLAIGQAIIDRILSRTSEAKDVNGSSFKGYDSDYKDSDTFKAFGKTSKVDMTLTGNMLSQIDIIEEDSNSITIGWEDDTENAKAYNHNTGDTVTKRQFFGVTAAELAEIQKEFSSELVKANYAQEQEQERKSVLDIVAGLEATGQVSNGQDSNRFMKLLRDFFDDDDQD